MNDLYKARAAYGLKHLLSNTDDKLRGEYARGKHELPFAPEGVNQEYTALRQMAAVPLVRLAVRTPCQRLRVDGFNTGSVESNNAAWEIWNHNRLASRQRAVYQDALTYERGGVVSVWINEDNPSMPYINPEDPMSVYVHPNPHNPLEALWAVKAVETEDIDENGELVTTSVLYLYDADRIVKYERKGETALEWVSEVPNVLGKVPFVVFDADVDAAGNSASYVDALIPMQRSIDTMRFDLLLAAQFAAYRQRAVVGYDPVLRDSDGNPIVQTDENGEPILDDNGMAQPLINKPGKAGVDRMLVFPGADTKLFDLPESNLSNYVVGMNMLVGAFASTAQIPPQYLVSDFSNTSGDLMTATEATLTSFVTDLQTSFGESWGQVMHLAFLARGEDIASPETVWVDARPLALVEVATAAAQMVPNGVPISYFAGLLPNVTPERLEELMNERSDVLDRALSGDFNALLQKPVTETE